MSLSKYVYVKKPGYNYFDLSHSNCLTGDMGYAYPVLAMEVYPGDIFNLKSTVFIRTKPMITAPFQNIKCVQRYFYVPLRFLMNPGTFEEFISGGKNLNTEVARPVISSGDSGFAAGSLADYLGYASNYVNDSNVSVTVANKTSNAWRLRAYAKAIRDYYINHDIEDEDTICPLSLEPGTDTTTNRNVFKVRWNMDYFNENLPFSGRGEPTTIGIGNSAPVEITRKDEAGSWKVFKANTNSTSDSGGSTHPAIFSYTSGTNTLLGNRTSSGNETISLDPNGNLVGTADLSSAVDVNVDELKTLFGIDSYKKLSARVGNTFKEFLLGMWGEHSNDLRIDRSHYLGGSISPILLEETSQTSASDDTSPQGNLTAHGATVNSGQMFKYKFDDYGILLGIVSVMPDSKYFQGQDRALDYEDWLDYPNPRLSLLGDQATYVGELLTQGDNASTTVGTQTVTNKSIFGFNPKFEEVRCALSRIHGQYKTNQKFHTQVREFGEPPLLNSSYLRGLPSKRIFAYTGGDFDSLDIEIGFKIDSWRRFPKYGNPADMGLMY